LLAVKQTTRYGGSKVLLDLSIHTTLMPKKRTGISLYQMFHEKVTSFALKVGNKQYVRRTPEAKFLLSMNFALKMCGLCIA
jgi:hypothetical protein